MKFRYSLQVMTVALGLSVASIGAVYAQASDAAPSDAPVSGSKLSPADQQFVQTASQSDATEIAASKIALKNSQDPHVRKFAQQMITDHTKLSHGMAALVSKKGFTTTPTADSALVGKLQTLKGKEFDQAYIQKVGLEGHKQAIAAFEKEIAEGQNADLKKAAQKALPTIKEHYQRAQQLAAKKGVTQ